MNVTIPQKPLAALNQISDKPPVSSHLKNVRPLCAGSSGSMFNRSRPRLAASEVEVSIIEMPKPTFVVNSVPAGLDLPFKSDSSARS
jgi:hypothetical protein